MRNLYHLLPILLLIVIGFTPINTYSQFYYKDIISTAQINETFKTYADSRVKSVTLQTFNGNTPITEGFFCEQKVNYRPNKITTLTKTSDNGESLLTAHFNADGLLIKSVDSNLISISTSTYEYNKVKQLTQLRNESRARDNSSKTIELHSWTYDAAGKPIQMTRVMNREDTTLIRFSIDETGNVGEEESFKRNLSQNKVYYYYDENNRLSDIVRYNERAKKLLPDYMFEYEDSGELSSMTIFPTAGGKIQKWYYQYDDKGLKLADFCYDKQEVLQGKVEYKYSF